MVLYPSVIALWMDTVRVFRNTNVSDVYLQEGMIPSLRYSW